MEIPITNTIGLLLLEVTASCTSHLLLLIIHVGLGDILNDLFKPRVVGGLFEFFYLYLDDLSCVIVFIHCCHALPLFQLLNMKSNAPESLNPLLDLLGLIEVLIADRLLLGLLQYLDLVHDFRVEALEVALPSLGLRR